MTSRLVMGLLLASVGILILVDGLPVTRVCPTDITFVIDNSGSIRDSNTGGVDNWKLILDFLRAIVDQLDVSPTGTRIAAADFGNAGRLDFNLANYSNKYDVMNAIGNIGYLGENTNLTGGLKVARTQVYETQEYSRPNVDRTIVVITDGIPTRDVNLLDSEVATIKSMGILIIALGVTNKVNTTILERLVTSPSSENYFYVGDFGNLNLVVERLTARACNWTYSTTTTTSTTVSTVTYPTLADVPLPEPVCYRSLDLALVIDASGSLNWNGWYKALDVATSIARRLPIGVDQTRVAVVVFGVGSYQAIGFGDHQTQTDLADAINRLRYTGGHTDINSALTLLYQQVFASGSARTDSFRAAVLITDGDDTESSDAVLADSAATCVDEFGIELFAVGITYRFNRARLVNIVGPNNFYEDVGVQRLSDTLFDLSKGENWNPNCNLSLTPAPPSSSTTTTFSSSASDISSTPQTTTTTTLPSSSSSTPTTSTSTSTSTPTTTTTSTTTMTPSSSLSSPTTTTTSTSASVTTTTSPTTTTPKCHEYYSPLDLSLVLDTSGSLGYDGWAAEKNFSMSLIGSLAVAPNMTQVAAVTFGNDGVVAFRLGDHPTGPEVVSVIRNLIYTGGSTNLNQALQLLWSDVYADGRGSAAGSTKIAVVVTDGEDTEDTDQTLINAQRCKDRGIRLMAVGITKQINRDRLMQIVSSPSDYFQINTVWELTSILSTVGSNLICQSSSTTGTSGP